MSKTKAKSQKKLVRPKKGRILGGVCLGLANHFNANPLVMRLGFLLLIFLIGPLMFLFYGICWVVIPPQK